MPVPVIIIGNLTIDDVIQADGSSQMGTLGGNSVHAAGLADVFMPSRAELTELTGCDDPEQGADGLLAAGVRCVVVKLGGDGALVARPGSPPAWVPAAPAEVADPTGA